MNLSKELKHMSLIEFLSLAFPHIEMQEILHISAS
jgi:hypothetical protein